MGSGRSGRRLNVDTVTHRLATWRRLAVDGVAVHIIAGQLGITTRALEQFILRQRRAGHPDAVLHGSRRAG